MSSVASTAWSELVSSKIENRDHTNFRACAEIWNDLERGLRGEGGVRNVPSCIVMTDQFQCGQLGQFDGANPHCYNPTYGPPPSQLSDATIANAILSWVVPFQSIRNEGGKASTYFELFQLQTWGAGMVNWIEFCPLYGE